MEIKYTIRVKAKHNPPEFKEGMGKGVIAIQNVEYKSITDKKVFNSPGVQAFLYEHGMELLEQWFEVVPEIVDIKKERKDKLNNLKN